MDLALNALRDVDGVLGSFVFDADGHVLARDLPSLFEADALTRGAQHLSRLRAALESSDGAGFESCVARFGPHLVLLRGARELTLCVLLPQGSNLGAIQMSATLIARRLQVPARNSEPGPAAQPSTRLFRGRRV